MTDAFLNRPQITLATALRLVEAAMAHGASASVPVAIAVSDAAGNLVPSARMDHAPLGAMRLARDKAYTSALWQMPSGDLRESSQPGGGDWGVTSTEGGRIIVYAGGLPIFAHGTLAGALGVSGGTGAQDGECAQAALAAVLDDA
ncbi:MAG: heme-binding protein [Actinomycetia bacterium]|nr:heme-binding protein [Actinomycetes bacterium]